MALKNDFEFTKEGFTGVLVAKDAYIKVESISGTKLNVSAEVSFTSSDNKLIKKSYYSFAPNLNGANFIKQAYEHLKTLPEFADAADV